MTQELFPEIQAATAALEKRISISETEVAQMQDAVVEKKRLIKGWKKAIAAVRPSQKKQSAAT